MIAEPADRGPVPMRAHGEGPSRGKSCALSPVQSRPVASRRRKCPGSADRARRARLPPDGIVANRPLAMTLAHPLNPTTPCRTARGLKHHVLGGECLRCERYPLASSKSRRSGPRGGHLQPGSPPGRRAAVQSAAGPFPRVVAGRPGDPSHFGEGTIVSRPRTFRPTQFAALSEVPSQPPSAGHAEQVRCCRQKQISM